jgi:hypothetical protein
LTSSATISWQSGFDLASKALFHRFLDGIRRLRLSRCYACDLNIIRRMADVVTKKMQDLTFVSRFHALAYSCQAACMSCNGGLLLRVSGAALFPHFTVQMIQEARGDRFQVEVHGAIENMLDHRPNPTLRVTEQWAIGLRS